MKTSETEKKLEFLDKLLEKNPNLQQQFVEYMQDTENLSDDDPSENIVQMARELAKELEALDLDNPDWENYTPRHSGYIEEWEAYMHMAEDRVRDVLENHETDLDVDFSKGKTDLALLGFVAGYDACLKAELQDEYDSLGDAVFFLKEEMSDMQKRIIQKLHSIVFPNRQVYDFLEVFFNHFKNHHHSDEEYLRFFEPLLLALSTEKELAEHTIRLLEEKKIPRHYIPRVATELYKVTENREKWMEEAEHLFEEDVEVARDLLTEYSQTNYSDFIRTAKRLWQADRFKKELVSFIFEHIDQKQSPKFYKDVLLWLTSTNKSVSNFKLLRNVLTREEKEKFIQAHKGNLVFFTRMLEQEQRYEEILQFIKKNLDSWHFNKMLTSIIKPYPEESFKILEQKILSTLETERGRGVYKIIVEWLQLARQIKGMEARTNQLIQRLYNWKPALPALKDELRQAGIR
jgi:hypothetical protein